MSRRLIIALALLADCTPDAAIARRYPDTADVSSNSCSDSTACRDDAVEAAVGIDASDAPLDVIACPPTEPAGATDCSPHIGASCRYPVVDHCAVVLCDCDGHWHCATIPSGTCDASRIE